MTQRLVRFDDLDGSPDARTYKFGWLGDDYEIDLCEANAKILREALDSFLQAARRIQVLNVPAISSLLPGADNLPARSIRKDAAWSGVAQRIIEDIKSRAFRAGEQVTGHGVAERYGATDTVAFTTLAKLVERGWLERKKERFYIADLPASTAGPANGAEGGDPE